MVTTSPLRSWRPRRVSTSPLTETSPWIISGLASAPLSIRSASLRNWPSRMESSRMGTSRGSVTGPSCPMVGRCSEEHAHRVDQHSDEPADDRAVDPDELEVPADVQLDLPGRLLAVPAVDGVRDHGRELVAVPRHREHPD